MRPCSERYGTLLRVYVPILYDGDPRPAGAFELWLPYERSRPHPGRHRARGRAAVGGFVVLWLGLLRPGDLPAGCATRPTATTRGPARRADRPGQPGRAGRRARRRSAASERTVALLLIDLDGFKRGQRHPRARGRRHDAGRAGRADPARRRAPRATWPRGSAATSSPCCRGRADGGAVGGCAEDPGRARSLAPVQARRTTPWPCDASVGVARWPGRRRRRDVAAAARRRRACTRRSSPGTPARVLRPGGVDRHSHGAAQARRRPGRRARPRRAGPALPAAGRPGRREPSRASRRWSAGSTRSAACWPRRRSCRSPSGPG